MSLSRRRFLGASGAALAAMAWSCAAQKKVVRPRRIVLLAGPHSHAYGEHEHPAGVRLMADRLGRIEGIEAQAIVGWPADTALLDDIDALVVYGDGGAQHPLAGHFDAIEPLAARGVGLGFFHFALIAPDETARRKLHDWIGGHYEENWSVNPIWTARIETLPEHPITRGVAPFVLEDEWYYHMRFPLDMAGVQPLLTALPPATSLGRPDGPHSGNPHVRKAVLDEKRPQHLAWCVQRADGGRGLGFTGLHWHWNWAHDGFRTFLLNAAVWLAGAEVPAAGVASEQPTLDELIELAGPPPKEWKREPIEERIRGWQPR